MDIILAKMRKHSASILSLFFACINVCTEKTYFHNEVGGGGSFVPGVVSHFDIIPMPTPQTTQQFMVKRSFS